MKVTDYIIKSSKDGYRVQLLVEEESYEFMTRGEIKARGIHLDVATARAYARHMLDTDISDLWSWGKVVYERRDYSLRELEFRVD